MRRREIVTITLGKAGWSIELQGLPEVASGFQQILTGWDPVVSDGPADRPVMATVRRYGKGYRWQGPNPKPHLWQRRMPATDVHVIADLHDVLFDWYLAERPDHLCLHAAAARIGEGLVCFPCIGRAGKSVLTTALAHAGARIFCDDVLPISPDGGSGIALGIAPRLRNPLPRVVGRALRAFVKARMGPTDAHWIYACMRQGEIAPYGEMAGIKAFILLQRERGRPTVLEPAKPSEILSEVIAQNFAKSVPALDAFDRLAATVQRARCHRLCYGDPQEAARYLMREFGGRPDAGGPIGKRQGRRQEP